MRRSAAGRALGALLLGLAGAGGVGALLGSDIVWPTPNTAVAEGRPYADFVQPTESGLVESGMFGCVRTSRTQFHEGIDLAPVARDRRGEPLDHVSVILPGVVRHINPTAGLSTFGRYVVVEHEEGPLHFVSLYAHLAEIVPGLRVGEPVTAGQELGMMGHSATYTIPRERAHLHLEVGFWLSRNFQRWYDAQKYPDRNAHGIFNGRNIAGLDFLDYVERRRRGEVHDLREYVQRLPVAVTVLVRRAGVPDFVTRHPELLQAPIPDEGVAGWRIDFTWYGLPKAWHPLTQAEVAAAGGGRGDAIVFHDAALLERYPCQAVVRLSRGRPTMGPHLADNLAILFAGMAR